MSPIEGANDNMTPVGVGLFVSSNVGDGAKVASTTKSLGVGADV